MADRLSLFQNEQRDKLNRVKLQIIVSVAIINLFTIGALIGQLISFDAALREELDEKIRNTFAFFNFQYNERFDFSELGLSRYQNTSLTCQALSGSSSDQATIGAVHELQRQFMNDRIWRTNEVIALVDRDGIVISSSGPLSANGAFVFRNTFHKYVIDQEQQAEATGGGIGKPLRISTMVDQSLYVTFQAPVYDAVDDYRPDLGSYLTQDQTLARVSLVPVHCGRPKAIGFLINVDSMFPRQYDYFGRLLFSIKSGIGVILARNTNTGRWQTAFSYNQPGPYGAKNRFPDMAKDAFNDNVLDQAMTADYSQVLTGSVTYEDVLYRYAMSPVPHKSVGKTIIRDNDSPVDILYAYSEPDAPASTTVKAAMSLLIPWMVGSIILSALSLQFVLRKFVLPMQDLIDSVKKKKMKEFNEHLRRLKSNNSAIWTLFAEIIFMEVTLLLLMYLNNTHLDSVASDFNSAMTEGKLLSYIASSRDTNLLYYLAAWASGPNLLNAATNSTFTLPLSKQLENDRAFLNVDAISLINLNSEVIASSHQSSIGRAFPEAGIMEYLQSQSRPERQTPFLATTAWSPRSVQSSTPPLTRGPEGAPALTRLIVIPIRVFAVNATTNLLGFGELRGAVVAVHYMNGLNSIWNVEPFTPGYFGIFLWDRYMDKFRDLTSVQKTSDAMLWGVDINEQNPGILHAAHVADFNSEHVYVQNGVKIEGQSFAAAIVPFRSADEVVLSPSLVNAYVVRGLSQSGWDAVYFRLLVIQIVNMAIVAVASLIKIVLAWLPLQRFLRSLERAFHVPSVAETEAAKREAAALAFLDDHHHSPSGLGATSAVAGFAMTFSHPNPHSHI